jgi:hypothetical protein
LDESIKLSLELSFVGLHDTGIDQRPFEYEYEIFEVHMVFSGRAVDFVAALWLYGVGSRIRNTLDDVLQFVVEEPIVLVSTDAIVGFEEFEPSQPFDECFHIVSMEETCGFRVSRGNSATNELHRSNRKYLRLRLVAGGNTTDQRS